MSSAARGLSQPLDKFRGISPASRLGAWRGKLLGELMFQGARLFAATIRVGSVGQEQVMAYRRQGRPLVFVGWHGHDVVHLTAYRVLFGHSAKAAIMVLDDVNGLALRHFARRMNLRVVSLGQDPESPQWARGVITMIKLVRQGYDAMVAADGPHGPRLQAKAGAVLIALRAKALVVPCSAACTRKIELEHRWDNHLVPLPFSRTLVHFGPPIDTQPTAGPEPVLEDLRAQLAAALESGTAQATAALRSQL